MSKINSKLEGYRTYISIAGIFCTVLASVLEGGNILTPEVTAALVALFSALAVFFRSQATK